MKFLVLASVIIMSLFSQTSQSAINANNIDAAIRSTLAKCASMNRLSPSDFERVAENNNTTVESLQSDCNAIAQMAIARRQANSRTNRQASRQTVRQPTRQSTSQTRTAQRKSYPSEPRTCDCGPFQTCVEQNTQLICVDKHTNANKCSTIMDCKSMLSRCENGQCT